MIGIYLSPERIIRIAIGIYLLSRRIIVRDWLDAIDNRNKAQAKYDKKNTVGFYMKLNIHTDADIIRWLWYQPSKQGAVKQLIRDEIASENEKNFNPKRRISSE